MAGSVGSRRYGGIAAVTQTLKEHRVAVEAELLQAGKHIDDLGTRALSWHDAYVILLTVDGDGPLYRSINDTRAVTTTMKLLERIVNLLLSVYSKEETEPQLIDLTPWITEENKLRPYGRGTDEETMAERLGWVNTPLGVQRAQIE